MVTIRLFQDESAEEIAVRDLAGDDRVRILFGTTTHPNETYGCRFYNTTLGNWSTNGCSLSSRSSTGFSCACTHLTSFTGFSSPRYNRIEQDDVQNLNLQNLGRNPFTLFSLVFVSFLYLLLLFCARQRRLRRLKEDLQGREGPEMELDEFIIQWYHQFTHREIETAIDRAAEDDFSCDEQDDMKSIASQSVGGVSLGDVGVIKAQAQSLTHQRPPSGLPRSPNGLVGPSKALGSMEDSNRLNASAGESLRGRNDSGDDSRVNFFHMTKKKEITFAMPAMASNSVVPLKPSSAYTSCLPSRMQDDHSYQYHNLRNIDIDALTLRSDIKRANRLQRLRFLRNRATRMSLIGKSTKAGDSPFEAERKGLGGSSTEAFCMCRKDPLYERLQEENLEIKAEVLTRLKASLLDQHNISQSAEQRKRGRKHFLAMIEALKRKQEERLLQRRVKERERRRIRGRRHATKKSGQGLETKYDEVQDAEKAEDVGNDARSLLSKSRVLSCRTVQSLWVSKMKTTHSYVSILAHHKRDPYSVVWRVNVLVLSLLMVLCVNGLFFGVSNSRPTLVVTAFLCAVIVTGIDVCFVIAAKQIGFYKWEVKMCELRQELCKRIEPQLLSKEACKKDTNKGRIERKAQCLSFVASALFILLAAGCCFLILLLGLKFDLDAESNEGVEVHNSASFNWLISSFLTEVLRAGVGLPIVFAVIAVIVYIALMAMPTITKELIIEWVISEDDLEELKAYDIFERVNEGYTLNSEGLRRLRKLIESGLNMDALKSINENSRNTSRRAPRVSRPGSIVTDMTGKVD